jgi:hypothetical protein
MPPRRKVPARSAFAGTSAPTATPAGKRGPGRPPVHAEAWTKVTVVLFNRQIVFLDRLASNIRARSGAGISRAQLIRALVDALADGEIDLTASRSEADLKATILACLRPERGLKDGNSGGRAPASGQKSDAVG